MECNKEEATRAKAIAEKKMHNKDFVAARKIALKAQQLFPELENISQMLTVCNVHCSSAVKVPGSELDWYGILQVEQTADEASIKKQYRKLALLLHPDKNKFAGAEAAFKLIGEAHRVLTDQPKRTLYDMKRRVNVRTTGTRQAPPHMNRNSHARKQSDIQNNFTNDAASQFASVNQQQTQAGPTFWTMCPFCSIRYQYYQSVMNRALRCQNCTKPFIAYDINAQGAQPPGHSWNQSSQSAHKSGYQGTPGNQGASIPEFFSKAESCTEFGGRSQSKATEDGNAAGRRAKSEEEKLEELNKRAQNRKRGRKTVIEESSESCDTNSTDEEEVGVEDDILAGQSFETTSSRYPRRSTRQKQHVTYKEGSDDDDFVRPHSSKKLKSGGLPAKSEDQSDVKFKGDVNQTREPAVFEDETYKKNGKQQEDGKKEEGCKDDDSSQEGFPFDLGCNTQSNPESMMYNEPEFNDFDKDRTESHFAVDQIWAAYDTNGCMPRFYARIRKILSEQSKVLVTWLEPHPDPNDQDEVDWVEEELPFACGSFILGSKGEVDVSSFSHLVSFEKGRSKGAYKVYPRKGDIWALFKDWNIKWSSDPDLHRECKFDVAEVLSDYDEGSGIKVAQLVKLKGFVSLFHQTTNKEMDSFQIPPNELLRFSHRIPFYRMTGKEREDVPNGSYELDPASSPTDIEEVGFVSFKRSDDDVVDVEIIEAQANGSCSKRATDCEKRKTQKNCKEPNEKNVQERDSMDGKGPSPRAMNGAYQNKGKQMDSGKCGPDGFFDKNEGEANVIKCEAEKEKHLDTGNNGPVNAAKHDNSSPVASPLEDFEFPDTEFFVFEAYKSEDKFQPDQIWALYSEVDGLPKFYGQIKKVAPTNLQVEIAWLEACRPSVAEIRWSNKELPVGCGKFRQTLDTEIYETTKTFSHQVGAVSISKNICSIYPREGEVWAVYKYIRVDWTRHDMENCEYDIVRVLKDTGSSLRVMILEKLSGYNCVFRDAGTETEILQKEFLRFSHQIPAFHLTEERGGKLRGYLELDPAAVPPILFCTTSN